MKTFIAAEKKLFLGNGIEIEFPHSISQVLTFSDTIVVRLEPEPGFNFNENVFGYSKNGELLWQIQKVPHVYSDSPYTNIMLNDGLIKAVNWDGTDLWLHPENGIVVKQEYTK